MLVLSGCQGSAPPATQAAGKPPASTAPAPAPVETIPAPSSLESRSWSALVAELRAHPDSVRAVIQTHAREVTVVYNDGRRYRATEPSIDAIIGLLHEIDPAGRILIATE
ncbi:MAG TPA: hypothetical protein VMG41_01915 [Gemmatimonadales bacterium]|nr:hypothetical protein [Gemmatimonadales bacterium]